jgi:hypothetical protein
MELEFGRVAGRIPALTAQRAGTTLNRLASILCLDGHATNLDSS